MNHDESPSKNEDAQLPGVARCCQVSRLGRLDPVWRTPSSIVGLTARSARWNEKWAVMFARTLRMVHKKLGSRIIYTYTHIYIYGYICTSVLASFPSCGDSLAGFGLRRASRNRLLGEMELTNTFKLREFCSLQYLRYKEMKHHKIGIE